MLAYIKHSTVAQRHKDLLNVSMLILMLINLEVQI